MVELADASDSKSDDGNIMWVQVPLPAPRGINTNSIEFNYFTYKDSFGMRINPNQC